jgi:hypothetical protein
MDTATTHTPLDRALFEAKRTGRWLAQALNVHETQVSRWRQGVNLPGSIYQDTISKLLLAESVEWATVAGLWPSEDAS